MCRSATTDTGRRCPNCGNKPANHALRRPRDRSRDRSRAVALEPRNKVLKGAVDGILKGAPINQTTGLPTPAPTKVITGRDKFLDLITNKGGATPRLTLVEVTNPQPEDAKYQAVLDQTTSITDFVHNQDGDITKVKLANGTVLGLTSADLACDDGLLTVPLDRENRVSLTYRLDPPVSAPLDELDVTGLGQHQVQAIHAERGAFAATVRSSVDSASRPFADTDDLRDTITRRTSEVRAAAKKLDQVQATQRGLTELEWLDRRDTADRVVLRLLERQQTTWIDRCDTAITKLEQRSRRTPDGPERTRFTGQIVDLKELRRGLVSDQNLLQKRRRQMEAVMLS
ncbi:hypothetical protein ACRAWC_01685 [Leifsonia sp. L25]|uniref:hypothetical protein n=1 Tax=Actinomycetes TaxID=1760 RepID=UPI003D6833BF